jgi:hypothetical protein
MKKALAGWKGHTPEEDDIRNIVVSYGILAPSPHNIQPWIVEYSGPLRMRLFIDPARLLPGADPAFRQIHIAQGTFLENISIASGAFGYRADIDYFPDGWQGYESRPENPVASIELVKDPSVEPDPLFPQIIRRETNKREYSSDPVTREQLDGLSEAYDQSTIPLVIVADTGFKEDVTEILVEAMNIEFSDPSRLKEMLASFRFSDEEIEATRDGFGLAQSGTDGIAKYVIEHLFLSREKARAPDSEFVRTAAGLTRKQSGSAAAFGWISTKGNLRPDQVRAGRVYERTCLKAAELGISIHPFSQVLETYPGMEALHGRFRDCLGISESHFVQMFFRMGFASHVTHSPRRDIHDIIRIMN